MILKSQTAIVTGARRGIGKAIARALAGEGARVMVVDINAEGMGKTVDEMQKSGLQAEGMKIDLTDPNQIVQMVERTVDRFGRLDILVNNAGVVSTVLLLDLTE